MPDLSWKGEEDGAWRIIAPSVRHSKSAKPILKLVGYSIFLNQQTIGGIRALQGGKETNFRKVAWSNEKTQWSQ